MLEMWTDFILNMGWLSLFLLVATLIRSKVKFIQNLFIPNSIIAGFIGLILGSQVLKLINIDQQALKTYIYHLLALIFIAISLKKPMGTHKSGKNAFATCLAFAMNHGLQAFIGLGLALIGLSTLFKGFNPASGVLVQLGFSNSPSLAYTIALGWENLLAEAPGLPANILTESGFAYSGDIGLTFGAIGFLIACICGVLMIRFGAKRGYITNLKNPDQIPPSIKAGYYKDSHEKREAGRLTTTTEALDTLALHVALVFIIYLATFYLIKLILLGIGYLPEAVGFLAKVITNFNFIIAALIAMLVRKIMDMFKISFLLDNGILERISGTSVDFMVTASLSAISIAIVARFLLPILITAAVAGIATAFCCMYLGSRGFSSYKFERIVTIFGIATGTMATGMALLRVMDPEFRTPVAQDVMYGSALVFFFTMPIMVLLNIPVKAVIENTPHLNWVALGILAGFIIVVLAIWRLTGLLRFKKPHSAILRDC